MSEETETLREQLLDICFPEDEQAVCSDPEDAITALVEALAFMLVVPNWNKLTDIPMSKAIEDIARRLRAAADARVWECLLLEQAISDEPSDTVR
jgi:hypothetical protein